MHLHDILKLSEEIIQKLILIDLRVRYREGSFEHHIISNIHHPPDKYVFCFLILFDFIDPKMFRKVLDTGII